MTKFMDNCFTIISMTVLSQKYRSIMWYTLISPRCWSIASFISTYKNVNRIITLIIFICNPRFIKIKPTIVYCLFSSFLFFGFIIKKNFLQIYLSNLLKLNNKGWNILTIRWGLFFLFMAILNEIIWRNFSTDFWVSFKVFGFLPITIIFTFLQQGLIKKYSIK